MKHGFNEAKHPMNQFFSVRAGPIQLLAVVSVLSLLSGCATQTLQPAAAPATAQSAPPVASTATPPGTGPAASPAVASSAPAVTSTPPVAGSAPPAAAGPRPFADVIKGATEDKGFFTTWKKDDKVWIEIPEEMLNKPFFMSVNITNGLGDAGIFGNQMGGYLAAGRGAQVVEFRRFGTQALQLIALNTAFKASASSPAARMVERSFSNSLINQVAIVSAPHPTKKSLLIEANALLLNDYPSIAARLELAFRQGYAFDPRNSSIDRAPNSSEETGFYVNAHYGLARLAVPPPVPTPGVPPPRVPSTLPDVRSAFFGVYYGFSKLPENPMTPRFSDPRVGYFSTAVSDFTDPDRRDVRSRMIHRWRLEKKDPNAAISEPKQPIVFWLDRNIPSDYRQAVTDGILEWNKAFEQAGFKNAIVVKQQEDNATFDTSATRFASVRWVAGRGIGFGARGPSKVDPRTGEILDADIEVNEDITRIYNARNNEDPYRPIGSAARVYSASTPHVHYNMSFLGNGQQLVIDEQVCTYAHDKLNEVAFGLELLVARGEMEYGSPEAKSFVMNALKDLIAHEVGHAIGLRHNFKGSTAITPEQLRDKEFGATRGISSSVMDYNALNIALKGERQGQYSMITVGDYDRWAVEFGYREFPKGQEAQGLKELLAKATRPELQYGTDEDAGFGSLIEGIDPETNRGDLSNNPLAFYEKRFAVARELWERWESKKLPDGTSYEVMRRNFERGFLIFGSVAELTAKYIGGVHVKRDPAGTGRQPLTPTDASNQRQAMKILTKNLFEVESFKFKPETLARMGFDFDSRFDSFEEETGGGTIPGVDYSLADRVLGLQRRVLAQLMRDTVAARVIGAPEKLKPGTPVFRLAELYSTLQSAVWSELDKGMAISPLRRNLQREHARVLAQMVATSNPRMPAEARSLQREFARGLLAKLRTASTRAHYARSVETRAHLNEAIDLLDSALKAQVSKTIG